MSTLPRDSTSTTGPYAAIPAAPSELEDAAREFEAAAERLGINSPARGELMRLCELVAAFTIELFPGEMRVQVKNDPEIGSDLYFLFGVVASGSIAAIARKNDEWHAKACQLPSHLSGMFRLHIIESAL